jgi:gliding motility-associated-like protein
LAPNLIELAEYTYAWSPADGLSCTNCANPQASPSVATDYELVIGNSLGCAVQASVRVDVVEAPPSSGLSIPNAFTPNNDGLNDVFIPVGSDQVHFQRFEVYNRWGELLFSARDFRPDDAHRGWDGTYRGRAVTTGTYTYRLVAVIQDKGRREYQGQVQLLR